LEEEARRERGLLLGYDFIGAGMFLRYDRMFERGGF
jgi:hypothetical protein